MKVNIVHILSDYLVETTCFCDGDSSRCGYLYELVLELWFSTCLCSWTLSDQFW